MAIWILYTECDSEPTFWGYVRSRKKAMKWVIEELESRDCPIGEIGERQGLIWSQSEDDAHYVHAVVVKPL